MQHYHDSVAAGRFAAAALGDSGKVAAHLKLTAEGRGDSIPGEQ